MTMRYLLLSFILSSAAWSQITVTAAANQTGWSCVSLTCAVIGRQAAQIAPQKFVITGTGSSLAIAFGSGSDMNLNVTFCSPGTGETSACSVVTSAPADMFLWSAGYPFLYSQAAGSYTETVNITASSPSSSIPITLNLTLNPQITITEVAPNGISPAGGASCITETSGTLVLFRDNNECNWSSAVVPGGNPPAGVPGAQGVTFVDPIFGEHITTIVPASGNIGTSIAGDAISGVINANNTLVQVATDPTATMTINSTATGLPVYTGGFSTADSGTFIGEWDTNDPTLIWQLNQGAKTFDKVVCSTPPTCTSTVWTTYSGTAAQITNSSDGRIRPDGWWGFITLDATDKHVCMIDLPNKNQYCADYSGLTNFSPRGDVQVSDVNTPDGRRYLYAGANSGANAWWYLASGTSPGLNALTPYGRGPNVSFNGSSNPPTSWFTPACPPSIPNGVCLTTQHSTIVMVKGIAYWIVEGGGAFPYYDSFGMSRIDRGIDKFFIPAEAGGGSYGPFMPLTSGNAVGPNNPDNNTLPTSIHVSAANNAPVITADVAGAGLCTWRITNVTLGPPLHFSTTDQIGGSCPLANGNTLLINGVGGITAANQTSHAAPCTVANLVVAGTSTWDCTGTSGSGTYTASTGVATYDSVPSFAKSRQSEILVYDLTNFPTSALITRWNLRSFSFPGYMTIHTAYYDQPHASVSNNGQKVCWQANYGLPENVGVYCGPTGYTGLVPATVSRGVTYR